MKSEINERVHGHKVTNLHSRLVILKKKKENTCCESTSKGILVVS